MKMNKLSNGGLALIVGILIQFIMIVLKQIGALDLPWMLVLLPAWGSVAVVFYILIMVAMLSVCEALLEEKGDEQ